MGSSLPVDKGVRFQQYMEMRAAGLIAGKSVLRKMGETEDEINKLEKEKKEEEAQVLQAQAALAPKPSAPVPPGGGEEVPAGEGGMPTPEQIAQLEAELAEAHP